MRWDQRFFLDDEAIDNLETEALSLLQTTGLRIESRIGLAALEEKLGQTGQPGVWLEGSRICFSSAYMRDFLAQNRQKLAPARPHDGFSMGVGDMAQHYLEPGCEKSSIMTVKSLIRATQFLDACSGDLPGVRPMVPGVPRDVPVRMQALTELMIGAMYCRNGGNIDTLHPVEAQPYIIDMLEALGGRLSSIAMFTISPLRLGGFEFDAAIRHMNRCERFHIASLPIPGMSAPIHIRPAWVVSMTEAFGGAATLSLLSGGKPISLSVGLFPFDVRHAWVAGGMPEHTLIEVQRAQITNRYDPGIVYSHSMTTSAHAVGTQAGVEKAANAQTAALLGCRDFNTLGLLGFDDIFSPEQFLLDVDTLGLIEANVRPTGNPPQSSWRGLIAQGLAKGFVEADETLDHYADVQHIPRYLDRRSLQTTLKDTSSIEWMRRRCVEQAHAYIRQHIMPEPGGLEAAMRIYDRAWQAFSTGKNPLT